MTIRLTPTLSALAVAIVALAACSDPYDDPTEGSIVGTVTSAARGPLVGVTVTASPGGAVGVTQETTGAYLIAPLTAGVYTVAVTGLPEGCEDPGTSDPAAVQANQSTTVTFVVTCTPLAEEQAD